MSSVIPTYKRSPAQEDFRTWIGYRPGSEFAGYLVLVNSSATDGNVCDLPSTAAALALDGGRRFVGIGNFENTASVSSDGVDGFVGVQVQTAGRAIVTLLANEACAAGEECGYLPSDAGKVKQITPANRGLLVPIGRFVETHTTSASDQQVGVWLLRNQNTGEGPLSVVVAQGASHTNTVAETTLGTATIAAYRVTKAGTRIHVVASGRASATNSTDTLQIKLYWGATQIAATTAVDVANGDVWHIDEWITVRTAGAAGTAFAAGFAGLAAEVVASGAAALSAIDFTAAITLSVKGTWSVASAGNVEALEQLFVEVKD